MATFNEPPLENLFRLLVHDIAMELSLYNCKSLKFIYKMNQHFWEPEMPGLEIMKELMSRNYFTYLKPDNLEVLLTNIKREDLINLVIKYKESNEFKLSQKQDPKKIERKQVKSKKNEKHSNAQNVQDQTDRDCCGHMASLALVHAAQTVGQTRYFLELMTNGMEPKYKKEVTKVSKDFERLVKSLNKAITAIKDMPLMIDQAAPKNKGSDSGRKKKLSLTLLSPSAPESRCSNTPTESATLSSSSSSSPSISSSKSEDDPALLNAGRQDLKDKEEENVEKIMQDSCTGDTGYDGSPLDFTFPAASLKVVEGYDPLDDEPDYDKLMPIQETLHRKYKELNLEAKDEPHQYTRYKTMPPHYH